MRNFVKFCLLALVAVATTASAAELEFHGYARAGIGLSQKGGSATCFGLSSADTKFRLGNECDYVIEPNFEYKFTTLEDKSAWGVHVMPSLYRTWGANGPAFFDDLPVRFGQIYFFGNNVPQLANGTIWGGRRFYDRLQTGINDQFLENEDGDGAGVEDMDLGFGKLSLAWLMNPNNGDPNDQAYKVTTRLTQIKTMKDGALSLWFGAYMRSQSTDQLTDTKPLKQDTTWRAAAYHTVNLGDWGSNLIGFKYNTSNDAAGKAKIATWRVVLQHGITFASAKTSVDFITEYRSTKDSNTGGATNNWFAIGARTDTQISGPFRGLLEAGYDTTKSDATGAKAHSLLKVTGALAVSGGNDAWSRPTFRLYYTYAGWNTDSIADLDAHWMSGMRNAELYGTSTSGGSFGVQAEGWW